LTLWYSAILLGILAVIGSLSYSVLRWSLMQDLDASLTHDVPEQDCSLKCIDEVLVDGRERVGGFAGVGSVFDGRVSSHSRAPQ